MIWFKRKTKTANPTLRLRGSAAMSEALGTNLAHAIAGYGDISHDRAAQTLDAAVDAIGRGGDLHALSKALAGAGLPQARAAEIARHLGSLGKSILDTERMIAHGLSNARWLWSGVCALEGHQAANGKVYDLGRGLSIDGHLSFPGREAGCSCVANGVVPGFG